METIFNASELIAASVKAIGYNPKPEDDKWVSKVVDIIGEMSREEYLALRSAWRDQYRALSKEIRETKPQRKGGNTVAQNKCVSLKSKARDLMTVRHAIRQCARNHASKVREAA